MLTKPFAKYPHSRSLGKLIFLAGQGCREPESNAYAGLELDADGQVVRYDIEAQTRGVLRNVERALAQHGLSKHHLIDVTVFLIHLAEDFTAMNRVWDEYFADVEKPPVRTTIGCKALPGLNYVEMKAIAVSD